MKTIFNYIFCLSLLFFSISCQQKTDIEAKKSKNQIARNYQNKEAKALSSELQKSELLLEKNNSKSKLIIKNTINKQALIIANGYYQKDTKWSNISSHNDIEIVKNALKKQGFLEKNIQIEKDLTYSKFIQVLYSFKDKLNSGDAVYIHISSHGQQIYDNNGDEIDGYDEAIVPVDAPGDYKRNGYTGDKHLRDDELGELFDGIRKQIGVKGNLFAVLDACHSGTGTRGLTKHRGTKNPFQPNDYEPKQKSKSNSFSLLKENKNLAPAVYFYGASANELNYEYKVENGSYVGSLSYAVSKAFLEADKHTTYQGLFDNVKNIMATIAPRQTPSAEGVLNQNILGGQLIEKNQYFLVTEYKKKDKDNYYSRLNAGTLMGLYKGSKVALYDIDGISDTKKPKATGVVIKADLITSQIKFDKPITENEAKYSWVIITEKNYGNLNISVSLNLKQKELENEIKSKIDNISFIILDYKTPDLVIESGNKFSRGENIQIFTKDDYVYWENDANQTNASDIIDKIKDFTQAKLIRSMEMKNKELDLTFQFVPLLMKDDGMDTVIDKELSIETKKDDSGIISFSEGDNVYVIIKNNSKKALYYTLIDIQPDNVINIVIPVIGRTASEYYLKSGEEFKHQLEFFPPFGLEVFKLIATEEPLELRSIIKNRGSRSVRKTYSNPFELLLEDSFKSEDEPDNRGGTLNIPKGAINIHTVTFKIKE